MAHGLLIVEDDPDIRLDLTEILVDLGYTVTALGDGASALSYLREGPRPCLILLDLMMPVMDGWQLRVELLKDPELASIPVLILSGAGDLRPEALALGALGFVNKPFDVNRLLGIIAEHC